MRFAFPHYFGFHYFFSSRSFFFCLSFFSCLVSFCLFCSFICLMVMFMLMLISVIFHHTFFSSHCISFIFLLYFSVLPHFAFGLFVFVLCLCLLIFMFILISVIFSSPYILSPSSSSSPPVPSPPAGQIRAGSAILSPPLAGLRCRVMDAALPPPPPRSPVTEAWLWGKGWGWEALWSVICMGTEG